MATPGMIATDRAIRGREPPAGLLGHVREGWRTSNKWAYLFILPPLIEFLIFYVWMVFSTVNISVQRWSPIGPTGWVGLRNYETVLGEPAFWDSMRITATYTLVTVSGGIFIALVMSEIIFRFRPKMQTFFKSAFYLPGVVSAVVISLIWIWLYQPWYGLFNYLLSLFDAGPVGWLTTPEWALFSLMLVSLASGHGGQIVFLTAAMGGVPSTLYEAARIDGAGEWTRFFKITLPLLKPTLLYLIVTGIIGSFQVFTSIIVMTPEGGPLKSTRTIGFMIYETAFLRARFDLASTQALLLLVVLLFFSLFVVRSMQTDVEF
jgi:multiple sugar transport system permease protein